MRNMIGPVLPAGRCLICLALALASAATASADVWATLAPKPGTKLVVMDVDGHVEKGRLLEWTTEAVAIQTETGRVDLSAEAVSVIRAAGPLGDFHTVYAPWENVGRLPAWQKIRVVRSKGMPVDGRLSRGTEEGITVARPGGKTVFVTRGDIRKVRILLKSGAETGFQIGASTGFLVAFAMLVAVASQGGEMGGAEGTPELLALGGGKAGQALASLFDQYQTIYLSPRNQKSH